LLYTDNDVVTSANLLAIDPEVASVATAEEIVIDGDGGVIREAWNESADRLLAAVERFTSCLGVSTNIDIARVSVGDPLGRTSPLRRWLICRALVAFYRAASSRREHDRYDKKRERFEREAKTAWLNISPGLPLVFDPFPCPGALYSTPYAGSWGDANVVPIAGGTMPTQTALDLAITWRDAQGVESGPSSIVTSLVPAGMVLTVDVLSLNPPTRATGWNVYAGAAGGLLTKQAEMTFPATYYALPNTPDTTGSVMRYGQEPDTWLDMQPRLSRG
jgi:hypothetical protein